MPMTIIDDLRNPRFIGQEGMRERAAGEIEGLDLSLRQAFEENARLRSALKPFAAIGQKIAHAVGPTKSFPPGVSARFLNLEPLTCQDFVSARDAIAVEQKADGKS